MRHLFRWSVVGAIKFRQDIRTVFNLAPLGVTTFGEFALFRLSFPHSVFRHAYRVRARKEFVCSSSTMFRLHIHACRCDAVCGFGPNIPCLQLPADSRRVSCFPPRYLSCMLAAERSTVREMSCSLFLFYGSHRREEGHSSFRARASPSHLL